MPGKTRVVHCKKEKFDIYIGRPGPLGNPFKIGKDGTREEVIAKFEKWAPKQKHIMDMLDEMEDKILGCWCKPHACHGDVYVKMIEHRRKLRDQIKRRHSSMVEQPPCER